MQGFFAAPTMAETLLARLSRWERERIILPLQSWSALTLPAQFLGLSVAGEVVLLTFAILYWCEHHTHDARARAHTHARTRRTDGNARAHAQIHARAQMRTRCGCSCCIDIRRRRSTQTRTNAIIQWNVSARTYPPAQSDDNPPPLPPSFPASRCVDQHKCVCGIWLVPLNEIANGIVKWCTRRGRPAWDDPRVKLHSFSSEFSFPSSHAQV